MKNFIKIILLSIIIFSNVNAANIFDYLKAGIVCPLVKVLNFDILAKGQAEIDNKLHLPVRLNEDMILEKVGFDVKNRDIIYYVKCSNMVDKTYTIVYARDLLKIFKNNPSMQCIFDNNIHYKYIFYNIDKNKNLKIINIITFPIKNKKVLSLDNIFKVHYKALKKL